VKAPANQPKKSQEYQMENSYASLGGQSASKVSGGGAYNRAQNAVGQPIAETPQVDSSMDALSEAVEFHIETVQMLLRRLHPVTGDLVMPPSEDAKLTGNWKVPVAQRVDLRVDQLRGLTAEVQNAIRALQI
jgi:hypothetical protein